jgi:hypothetical protein
MTTLQLILAAEQVIARLLAIPAAALTARKHLSRGNVDRTPGPETTVSGAGTITVTLGPVVQSWQSAR